MNSASLEIVTSDNSQIDRGLSTLKVGQNAFSSASLSLSFALPSSVTALSLLQVWILVLSSPPTIDYVNRVPPESPALGLVLDRLCIGAA